MGDESKEIGINPEREQQPLKILLVEDEMTIVPLIKRVLKEHNVTSFASAEEALDALRKGALFDWVITDRGLAGEMDGFGLADIIKNDELGHPFVTLLTASATAIEKDNSPAELKKKGIHQLMGKPFDVKQLKNSVNDAREFNKQSQVPQASKI